MSAPRVHPGASATFAAALLLALAGGAPAPARAAGTDPGLDPGASFAAPPPVSHRFT